MPLQETSGTASYDAFGGGIVAEPNYIESCFSTWLYTGNGSTQTINNGIDLSGKGGMLWIKSRSNAFNHWVVDSARGTGNDKPRLQTNTTAAQFLADSTAFGSSGFTVYGDSDYNSNGATYASWTFRKQPKFFDVVTYTGTGSAQNIAHNLGSVPGLIIVKGVSGDFSTGNWAVYHRSLTATTAIQLNNTNAAFTTSSYWNNTEPTSTRFTVGTAAQTGAANTTYVAYLFAHNAGGFGLTGTDNVISCGSFTASGSAASVNLGWEPQYVLYKCSSAVGGWEIVDNMRGFVAPPNGGARLFANNSNAELNPSGNTPFITSTGFYWDGSLNFTSPASGNFIYIAIRRGPMKTPTSGTSVFDVATRTGTGATATITTNIYPVDMLWAGNRSGGLGQGTDVFDRLRGANTLLLTPSTGAEVATTDTLTSFAVQNGYILGADAGGYGPNYSGQTFVNWNFKRAPGFFDEVCYTGNGTFGPKNHNLGVVPELIISRARSTTSPWYVWNPIVTSTSNMLYLNTTAAYSSYWSTGTWATTSTFYPADDASGQTYVAYLFASCTGVSKVGTYTGNGSTQTINCGFTGGARFVLIKRTDSTGNWYVYDTARGMTTLTDPYLLLNSTAAESATLGSVTSVTGGFALNASILAAINTNAASYIFLAIA